jgi:hypothetical protein
MSDIKIQIVAIDITQPEGKKFQNMEVTYKNLSFQGKAETKKINSYYGKAVWAILADAQKGDVFTVSRAKEGEFWQWTGITSGEAGNEPSSSTTTPAARSTNSQAGGSYSGTKNDDVQKMIIRQSSIASAVNLIKGTDGDNSPERVVSVARIFEAYVHGIEAEVEEVVAKVVKKAKAPTTDIEFEDDTIPF